MAIIKVFPFTYYDSEQGIRLPGSGMCTEEKVQSMRENSIEKDHQIIQLRGIEIDESKLAETGRYYPPYDGSV